MNSHTDKNKCEHPFDFVFTFRTPQFTGIKSKIRFLCSMPKGHKGAHICHTRDEENQAFGMMWSQREIKQDVEEKEPCVPA